jgi:hypothetical protein
MRISATFDRSAKVESGRGWLIDSSIDAGHRAFAGLGFTERNGGAWSKHVIFARAGMAIGPGRITLRRDLTSPNRVSALDLSYRQRVGPRLTFEPCVSMLRYNQGSWGLVAQGFMGWAVRPRTQAPSTVSRSGDAGS